MSTTMPAAPTPPFPSAPNQCCSHCEQHRRVLGAGLSAGAYALYSALLLRIGTSSTVSCSDIAAAAGLAPYQARPLLGELVRSGLLARERRAGRRTTVTSFSTTWKDAR